MLDQRRTNKYPVGKEIGGDVYAHRQYEDQFPSVQEAKAQLPAGTDYQVVKYNARTGAFSFIKSSDFDTADEPSNQGGVRVTQDGDISRSGDAGWIYHHKWMMVADDYQGFDVEESKARSQVWTSLHDVDRSRIGQRKFWDSTVVPRLS